MIKITIGSIRRVLLIINKLSPLIYLHTWVGYNDTYAETFVRMLFVH